MNLRLRTQTGSLVHVLLVAVAPVLLFSWLFARFLLNDLYLIDSDLYEYFLPVFLSPIRVWSSFEFSGLPAFADPGDYTFYPPSLLGELVGSWTLLVMAASIVAAWGTYAYVHGLTGSRAAAAFSAAAYSLSETMMERLAHLGAVHAIAWFPLMAMAVDRVRGDRWPRWMAIGAFAVACSILAGHPQPTVYGLYCLGFYALIGSIVERVPLRTYVRTAAMFALGAALAGIKVLPILEASALMARQEISFDRFVGRALTFPQTLSAFFPTIVHGDSRESPTYVGIATLLLATMALPQMRRHWRIAFWSGAALFGLLVGLGDNTPVAALVHHLPLYDKFRVGSRHLFLFAFGAIVLAGYALAAIERREISRRAVLLSAAIFLAVVCAAAAALVRWPSQFQFEVGFSEPGPGPLAVLSVGVWLQFAVALAAAGMALWMWWAKRSAIPATLLVLLLVADMVRALPYDMHADGLDMPATAAINLKPSVHAEALGRELRARNQRALALGGTQSETVLPAAFARVWRIPIAGGYGPMLLERYSQFGMMGTNGSVRPFLLANEDAALDLLAVRYLLVYPQDLSAPATFERDGVVWTAPPMELPVGRPDCDYRQRRTSSLGLPDDVTLTAIVFVTRLECSEAVPQDTEVAKVTVIGAGGGTHESIFRAGVETAEGDLAEPEIRQRALHQPATRFDDGDESRYVYSTRITLPAPMRGGRIEIDAPGTGGWLTLERITLIDDKGQSHPQSSPQVWLRNPERWREVTRFSTSRTTDRGADADIDGELQVTVLENLRALPRAWFVADVMPLGDADALASVHYSQLPDGRPFEPRAVALVDPSVLPPAMHFTPGRSTAQVTSVGDGELSVVASTEGGGFLVLSEAHYPGWRARIDGDVVPVYRTNLTLQGIVVPPGLHRIEFELASTSLRAGTVLSSVSLLACVALLWRGRAPRG